MSTPTPIRTTGCYYPDSNNTYTPSESTPQLVVNWVDLGPAVVGEAVWQYLVERQQQ